MPKLPLAAVALLAALTLATTPAPSAAQTAKKPAKTAKASPTQKAAAGKQRLVAKASANVAAKKQPVTLARKGKAVVAASKAGIRRVAFTKVVPERPSFGQIYGLHLAEDSLDLKSGVALVVDQDTNEVLFSKNAQAVLPIASITKLMTALVVTEAGLPLDTPIEVTQDDVDTEKFSRSRLAVGTTLSRGDLLHLALMASENRAAHALGRTYPGGLDAFVARMNQKAQSLGMRDTRYVEPTGLSSQNQSSARDLATLVKVAHEVPLLRELSTSPDYAVEVKNRAVQFRNTNGLVRNPEWQIGLQKTGYISEAGRCLVMQASMAGRQLIMVFLDSAGKYSRIGDAERVRKWLAEQTQHVKLPGLAAEASRPPV